MKTETIISAYLNAEGRLGPFIFSNVGEAPHSRGNRLARQYDVFRHEMYRRANDYDRLRAAIPTVSIPSSWPANMLPAEAGVMTTTAKKGDPLVWVAKEPWGVPVVISAGTAQTSGTACLSLENAAKMAHEQAAQAEAANE